MAKRTGGKGKGKKRKNPVSKAITPPGPAPSTRSKPIRIGVLSLAFICLPLLPYHPLSFLPAVIYWPMYCSAVIGWWLRLSGEMDWFKPREAVVFTGMETAGLVIAFGSFLLLKLVGLHPSGTDENIYYYMAVRMSEGAIPYKDFFFSHPPVHLLVPGLVFGVSGFSIGVAKVIPVLAQVTAGLFLYLTVRRSSRAFAFVVLLTLLTTYQVLMGSTDMNGENLMMAFLMASMFYAVRGSYLTSGVLAGLGLGCGLYALATILALAVAVFFSSRKAAGRYGLGFLVGFGGVVLPFLILGGSDFIDGVFGYHLAKPMKGSGRIPVFGSFNPFTMIRALFYNLAAFLGSKGFGKSLYFHAPEYLAAMLAAVLILGRAFVAWWSGGDGDDGRRNWITVLSPRGMLSGSPEGLVKLTLLGVVLFLFEYAALNEFYDFYAIPMLSLLSVPAAYALYRIYIGIRDSGSWGGLVVPVLLAVVFGLNGVWASYLNRSLWPEEVRNSGDVVEYDWREPWVLSGPAELTRTLFFEERRIKGEVTPYYRHYVWNKRLTFSMVDDIADHIRQNTLDDETITGASTIAPLLALYSGRRMSADEADTNSKRFKAGVLSEAEFFDMICSDQVRFIVSAQRSKFTPRFMESNPTVRKFFKRDRDFVDTKLKHFRGFPITLYRRLDTPGLPEGKVCRFVDR